MATYRNREKEQLGLQSKTKKYIGKHINKLLITLKKIH